jgi:uncharacterized protein YecE (DUF72 family)
MAVVLGRALCNPGDHATFYRIFSKHVFERWVSLAPENFTFDDKGPKSITRDRHLKDAVEDLVAFLDRAQVLGEKLVCVIWQVPPSFKLEEKTLEWLNDFVGLLPTSCPITCCHTFECPHKSWDAPQVLGILRQHNVACVSADSSWYYNAVHQTADLSIRECFSVSFLVSNLC